MSIVIVVVKGPMSIDVQRAVAEATNYLRALYGGDADDVLLEEVELDSAKDEWVVTLSFTRKGEYVSRTPLTDMFGGSGPFRRYKVFRLSAETGEVRSMKIRPTEK